MSCFFGKALFLFYLSLSALLLTGTECMAGRSTDGVYTITTNLIGGGGAIAVDSAYQLQTSIGQPGQGNMSSPTHMISAGFLPAVKLPSIVTDKDNFLLLFLPAIISQPER